MPHLTRARRALSLAITAALCLSACGPADDGDTNNPQNTTPRAPCPTDAPACVAPAATCEGDFAVTFASIRDEVTCACVPQESARQDCAATGQVCEGSVCAGDAIDPCEGITCDAPPASCEGDIAITYSGAGMCVAADGSCDYEDVAIRTDCAANSEVCQGGACVEPNANPCDGITCNMPPAPSCDGAIAVTYAGMGMCAAATGVCDYAAAQTRTDCAANNERCEAGACVEVMMNLCANVTCALPPAPSCDGEFAVTYTGEGMCVMADGSCDYSAVGVRTDCEASGESCVEGACAP